MYAKVYVEITNICNMNCSFCHGHGREPGRMSREQLEHILTQLADQTKYIYFHLMGEPLAHPQLPEFIRMAAERGYKPCITTNGTLLSRRKEELIGSGVHKVSISLHSFEDGAETDYEAYMADVTEFADQASREGILVVFRLWNRGYDEGRNDTTLQYLQEHLEGEWKENTRGFRVRDKLHLEWGERFEWPDLNAPVQGEQVFCYGLGDHFGILCDGTVVPCCLDSNGVISLGNIFSQNIEEILQSPRAEKMVECFKQRKASEELCRRCGYAQRFIKKKK